MSPDYEMLQKIKERPALFIGEKNLSHLSHFINGYSYRAAETDQSFCGCLPGFGEFVHRYYNLSTSMSGEKLIIEREDSEEKAFEKFYELLDNFTERKIKHLVRCSSCGHAVDADQHKTCPNCSCEKMRNLQCPCCGNYTIIDNIDFCRVCFWFYGEEPYEILEFLFSVNHHYLRDAKENYQQYGAIDLRYKSYTRPPLPEELPENNMD